MAERLRGRQDDDRAARSPHSPLRHQALPELVPLAVVDFDNDSAFMNEVVIPWCRGQKLEVTRSRPYKKNDQAFVEQKNGAESGV